MERVAVAREEEEELYSFPFPFIKCNSFVLYFPPSACCQQQQQEQDKKSNDNINTLIQGHTHAHTHILKCERGERPPVVVDNITILLEVNCIADWLPALIVNAHSQSFFDINNTKTTKKLINNSSAAAVAKAHAHAAKEIFFLTRTLDTHAHEHLIRLALFVAMVNRHRYIVK